MLKIPSYIRNKSSSSLCTEGMKIEKKKNNKRDLSSNNRRGYHGCRKNAKRNGFNGRKSGQIRMKKLDCCYQKERYSTIPKNVAPLNSFTA